MRRYHFIHEGRRYERVSKRRARAVYNRGEVLVMIPCNLRPFTPWHIEAYVSKDRDGEDFDRLVRQSEPYNCINSETGLYMAYYVVK